ncbi:MAG: hypothetical protein M1815_001675 [Lichina confinis]|nr:MAG: hypothetical protein M1815_001675 [Lichina confinis]
MAVDVPVDHRLPDSLPRYTEQPVDAETMSIRSAAPSYTSAAPSYHSNPGGSSAHAAANRQSASSRRQTQGNALRPARTRLRPANPTIYSIPTWSSTRSPGQERIYNSVARRRQEEGIFAGSPCRDGVPSFLRTDERPSKGYSRAVSEESSSGTESEAAEEANRQLKLKERREQAEAALQEEGRSWDIMLRHMAQSERVQKYEPVDTFKYRARRERKKAGLPPRTGGLVGWY